VVDPVQAHCAWHSESTQSWDSWSAPLCADDVPIWNGFFPLTYFCPICSAFEIVFVYRG